MLDHQTKPLERSNVTLDAAFKAMQHWRDNKADYDHPGVPDTVWQLIFQLEAQPEFDKTTLCLRIPLAAIKGSEVSRSLALAVRKVVASSKSSKGLRYICT